ncbi:hypothetical protein GCM10009606_36850 [Nocardioides aquiterrae]|uniref:Uncharacterized protein n=1 Tax=Nocardioides aquiterrae TaxID=203799 RepID=A0ABN1UKC3_9ACTN
MYRSKSMGPIVERVVAPLVEVVEAPDAGGLPAACGLLGVATGVAANGGGGWVVAVGARLAVRGCSGRVPENAL